MTCRKCKYFVRDSGRKNGRCHRRPPVPIFDPRTEVIVSLFPIVMDDWRCGSFRVKREEPRK